MTGPAGSIPTASVPGAVLMAAWKPAACQLPRCRRRRGESPVARGRRLKEYSGWDSPLIGGVKLTPSPPVAGSTGLPSAVSEVRIVPGSIEADTPEGLANVSPAFMAAMMGR